MRRCSSQRGLSLVEVLVAFALLAMMGTVLLMLYDSARRSYKSGENRTEQQQVVRIAFDRLSSDLRLAGYNHNPDGRKDRPDEAIEGAFDTAIVIRADFDALDPAESLDNERELARFGVGFDVVPTGNDEIVTYVLAKADDPNPDVLSFDADVVDVPRDGEVESVTVDNVALGHSAPPYTLYRITLDRDGAPSRAPLIENVRSLRFTYYGGEGQIVPAPGGADDADGRRLRSSIRRIGVEIEGLTRDPSLVWQDETDADLATRRLRKFMLVGDVKPRNLGRFGARDLQSDTSPPSPPSTPELHPGHCGGLWINWVGNPAQDEVAYYLVRYGQDPAALADDRGSATDSYYLDGLLHGATYYVAIEAVDEAGNRSLLSATASATTSNINTPLLPQGLVAEDVSNGPIELSWQRVSENATSDPGADPLSPRLRDFAGYRVYRAGTPGFTPDPASRIAAEDALPDLPQPLYLDSQPMSCRDQYYKVTAVDRCGQESEPSNEVMIPANATGNRPKAPYNEDAYFLADGRIRLKWRAVREDILHQPIYVDDYKIFRTEIPVGGNCPTAPLTYSLLTQVSGVTEYIDDDARPPGQTFCYSLTALDECLPPNESYYSSFTQPTCSFPGDLVILAPAYGSTFNGDVTFQLTVNGADPGGSYGNVLLKARRLSSGNEYEYGVLGTGPVWTYLWADVESGSPGHFEITASIKYVAEPGPDFCLYSTSIFLTKEP